MAAKAAAGKKASKVRTNHTNKTPPQNTEGKNSFSPHPLLIRPPHFRITSTFCVMRSLWDLLFFFFFSSSLSLSLSCITHTPPSKKKPAGDAKAAATKKPKVAKKAPGAKKQEAKKPIVKARGYVKRYPRLSKKVSEGVKLAQTKQRALAIAKVIAQVM